MQLPTSIEVKNILGGLAAETRQPMPATLQKTIQGYWRKIQHAVPGTEFNFDFWTQCQPRRSTYPACRAVIAARTQAKEYEEAMILAIQQAYYLQARNPSDKSQLVLLAQELGLDNERFEQCLDAEETVLQLQKEVEFSQALQMPGFPSLVLQEGENYRLLRHNYTDAMKMLVQLN